MAVLFGGPVLLRELVGQPLGHADHPVVLVVLLAPEDGVDDAVGQLVDVHHLVVDILGGDHLHRFAGNAGGVGQPARLAAHQLDDEIGAGALGVGLEVEQRLLAGLDAAPVAEGPGDAEVIVVDGLRYMDHRQPELAQEVGRLERVVAADGDQASDAQAVERLEDVEQLFDSSPGRADPAGEWMARPGLARDVFRNTPRRLRRRDMELSSVS